MSSNLLSIESSFDNLPETVTTMHGATFDPRENLWKYRDATNTINCDFSKLPPMGKKFLYGLKRTLIYYVENGAPANVTNSYSDIKSFLRFLSQKNSGVQEMITDIDLRNYRATMYTQDRHDNRMSHLSGFLLKWHDLGLSGVDQCAAKYLREARFTRSQTGTAVTTMDPIHGPLTDTESEALRNALINAFEDGLITIDRFVLVILANVIGARPDQFASMKLCDFAKNKDGQPCLHIPLVKGISQLSRSEFVERTLTEELAILVQRYTDLIAARFADRIENIAEAPFFPMERGLNADKGYSPGFVFHTTSEILSRKLKFTVNRLNVISERTLKKINIHFYRLRRTLATNAVREGYPLPVVAELLGHRWLVSVGIYAGFSNEVHDRLDKAMVLTLGPTAQKFTGDMISTAAQMQDFPPNKVLYDPHFSGDEDGPMGGCGKHGYCSLNKPIACYTCRKFRPWLDGPHEQVLEYLIDQRNTLLSTSPTVAKTTDRQIFAVGKVIHMCKEEHQRRADATENVHG